MASCCGIDAGVRAPTADSSRRAKHLALQALLAETTQHTYLVRIDRQRIDIALELLASDGRQVVKVDSPTLRSGPELLLLTLGADPHEPWS